MPTTARVQIEIDGNFHPIRIAKSARRGVDGYLLSQGPAWIWIDANGFEDLIDAADQLAEQVGEDDEQARPQLGRLERFPRANNA